MKPEDRGVPHSFCRRRALRLFRPTPRKRQWRAELARPPCRRKAPPLDRWRPLATAPPPEGRQRGTRRGRAPQPFPTSSGHQATVACQTITLRLLPR